MYCSAALKVFLQSTKVDKWSLLSRVLAQTLFEEFWPGICRVKSCAVHWLFKSRVWVWLLHLGLEFGMWTRSIFISQFHGWPVDLNAKNRAHPMFYQQFDGWHGCHFQNIQPESPFEDWMWAMLDTFIVISSLWDIVMDSWPKSLGSCFRGRNLQR